MEQSSERVNARIAEHSASRQQLKAELFSWSIWLTIRQFPITFRVSVAYLRGKALDDAPPLGVTRIHLPLPFKQREFCQFIPSKIEKILASRCQILRRKCTKFHFGWCSAQVQLGELSALPIPLVGFKGPIVLKRKGEGREGEGILPFPF